MNVVAVVQARMGSVRFPGKVLHKIAGAPLIDLLLERLSQARLIDQIVVATSTDERDRVLTERVVDLGFSVFRGSEDDVLDRVYQAAKVHDADVVVRITGDCPLIDPELVDEVVSAALADEVDYACNTMPPTYPDGLDTEAFTFTALERAWREAAAPADREHVTPFLQDDARFRLKPVTSDADQSHHRWTVDEPADVEVITNVLEHFAPRRDFGWMEVLSLAEQQPQLFASNQHLVRNAGETLASGQKLWTRAKRVIPGGGMLLSKRPEMFLPDRWPTYFSRASGCRVWDLDGHDYTDISLMGVGTNLLGYGHPEVDAAVRQAVNSGNMSTLNAPEEVELAERLIGLHPWAEMVRFGRTGGEANAIAVRLARAATGRDCIAVCGYHGWHDWYLAGNLAGDDRLSEHLLPGLEPAGVPRALEGTVHPFRYNALDELEAIVRHHDLAAIKMEVSRNVPPDTGFLEGVRRVAFAQGAVLIFDECTSGFRQTFGGLHLAYGVEPDLAVYGKALGNGYAITAVIGRRAIMDSAQRTFMSSTFWTERIGSCAALKTLEVMEEMRAWELVTEIGHGLRRGWLTLASNHGLDIELSGLAALSTFRFRSHQHLAYKTLITQELLSRGYLATTGTYASIAHVEPIISRYLEELDAVFALIRECEDGRDVSQLLRGPVSHAGLSRLN